MTKKNVHLLLAIVLLVCFFLPYISFPGFTMNGFQTVFGKSGAEGIGSGRLLFACLLIPIGAIMILLSSWTEKRSTLQDYVFWMPLVGVLVLTVVLYLQMNKGARLAGGDLGVSYYLNLWGYGLWITLIAAIGVVVNEKANK